MTTKPLFVITITETVVYTYANVEPTEHDRARIVDSYERLGPANPFHVDRDDAAVLWANDGTEDMWRCCAERMTYQRHIESTAFADDVEVQTRYLESDPQEHGYALDAGPSAAVPSPAVWRKR